MEMRVLLHFATRRRVTRLVMEILMVIALITLLGVVMNDMRAGVVDELTEVINDGLNLVSEQIARLDRRIDSLRIVAGD